MAILTLRPDSDNSVEQTPSTGTDHYALVDEVTLSESDYCQTSGNVETLTKTDIHGFPNHTTEAGTINSVTVKLKAKYAMTGTDTGDAYISPLVKIGSTVYNSGNQTLTSSTAEYYYSWANNPSTSAAWSWANIDDLLAGDTMTSHMTTETKDFKNTQCFQLWVEVDYEASTNINITVNDGIVVSESNGQYFKQRHGATNDTVGLTESTEVRFDFIDIGSYAINRSGTSVEAYTFLDKNNPANATGTLKCVELWFATDASDVVVGTFYGSGTSWTCRDSAAIGSVTAGAKQTINGLSIDVQTGDIIGIYFSAGTLEVDETGYSGLLFRVGNAFSGTNTYNDFLSAAAMSVFATNIDNDKHISASDLVSVTENQDVWPWEDHLDISAQDDIAIQEAGFIQQLKIAIAGQSNALRMSTTYGGTSNVSSTAGTRRWDGGAWINPVYYGEVYLANQIRSTYDGYVSIVNSGQNGSNIHQWTTDNTFGSTWAHTLDVNVNNAFGSHDLTDIIWIQGEADGVSGLSYATYKSELETLFGIFRTNHGANVRIHCGLIGRTPGDTSYADHWDDVRRATVDVCEADGNAFIGSYNVDIPILPNEYDVHYDTTEQGFGAVGKRLGNSILYQLGLSSYYRGPILSYTNVSATQTRIHLKHYAGTDFTPTSGITGIDILDDGSLETNSSVVRETASTILVTHGEVTGAKTVRYQYGSDPTVTGAIHDNSALALPAEWNPSINENIYKYEEIGITDASGVTLSGLELSATTNDSISIVEDTTAYLGQQNISISDDIGVEDSPVVERSLVVTAYEDIGIVEAAEQYFKQKYATANDDISITDTPTASLGQLFISINDLIGIEESVAQYLGQVHATASDAIELLDECNALLSETAPVSVNVNELITISEGITLYLQQLQSEALETIGVSESIALRLNMLVIQQNESIGISESVDMCSFLASGYRTLVIAAQDRDYLIAAQDRDYLIDAANRELDI